MKRRVKKESAAGSRASIIHSVKPLLPPDLHHLNAAMGWLGLGCPTDAREELKQLSAASQQHPEALEVRWTLCVCEESWTEALAVAELELIAHPIDASGWLHRAYALRRIPSGGLEQAWKALLPASEKFPTEPVIPFNLDCYACQQKKLELARQWLQRSIQIGGKEAIKKMALADEDLKPLWPEIQNL